MNTHTASDFRKNWSSWPQNFPNSASHENEISSLSWYISKSSYQIWVVEVSKSEFMNKYSQSKNIFKIRQKTIVWCFVFCGSPSTIKKWPLFKFLDLLFEEEAPGYNGGIS